MAAGNTYTQIASTTLGSAASSVTFSSIAATYTDLVLVVSAKSTSSAQNLFMRVNSDTGTNYSTTLVTGSGTAVGSARTSSATQSALDNYGYVDTANHNTNIINLMNYANTSVYKTWLSRAGNAANGTTALVGLWRSTSAINAIEIYIAANTFTAGSTFNLYGITAA
jgi:hypothetical protein